MVETAASVGSVTQIIGPVLDVEFTEGKLPAIFSAILVKGDEGDIVCEVQQLLGNNRVRAVSMSSTDGLKRGVEAVDTGEAGRASEPVENRKFISGLSECIVLMASERPPTA